MVLIRYISVSHNFQHIQTKEHDELTIDDGVRYKEFDAYVVDLNRRKKAELEERKKAATDIEVDQQVPGSKESQESSQGPKGEFTEWVKENIEKDSAQYVSKLDQVISEGPDQDVGEPRHINAVQDVATRDKEDVQEVAGIQAKDKKHESTAEQEQFDTKRTACLSTQHHTITASVAVEAVTTRSNRRRSCATGSRSRRAEVDRSRPCR